SSPSSDGGASPSLVGLHSRRRGLTEPHGGIPMRLKGKVALITGGSRGIGRGIALAFGREGAKVAITYYSSEGGARDTIQQIREAGGEAEMYHADAGDTAQMESVFKQV